MLADNSSIAIRLASLLTAIVLVGGLATGCGGGEDTGLGALRVEKIATFSPPGGTLELPREGEENAAPAVPTGDVLLRVFAFGDKSQALAGLEAAIEAAAADGWQLRLNRGSPEDAIFGAKTLAIGDATLTIDDYDDQGRFKILIRVEQRTCPAVLCTESDEQAAASEAGPGTASAGKADGGQPSSGQADSGLPLSGSIIVLPSRPNAWAGGPYVTRVGRPIELDASGSYDSDGRIVSFEWDLDGDGDFDVTTPQATYEHTFTSPIDGRIGVRVTDDDGRTAVAKANAHASSDGDEVPPTADNCPTLPNRGQSDFDEDGVGDVCDSTPFG